MLCETCDGRDGPASFAAPGTLQEDRCAMIPCPDCGGQGIAHCCDGACEQPNLELMNESKRRLG